MKNRIMKILSKTASKASKIVVGLAFLTVYANINSTCMFMVHQPKLPENAKKLRNF